MDITKNDQGGLMFMVCWEIRQSQNSEYNVFVCMYMMEKALAKQYNS